VQSASFEFLLAHIVSPFPVIAAEALSHIERHAAKSSEVDSQFDVSHPPAVRFHRIDLDNFQLLRFNR
jgi:hypothetical protein